MVCVSTHGCLDNPGLRKKFIIGLEAMFEKIQPSVVLVHGSMPEDVFGQFIGQAEFHRYASDIERAHRKKDVKDGNGI